MFSVYCHISVLFMSLGLSSILFKNCIDPYARKTHMRSAPSQISHRPRHPLSHRSSRLPRPLRCLSMNGTSTRRVVHVWSLESTRIKTPPLPPLTLNSIENRRGTLQSKILSFSLKTNSLLYLLDSSHLLSETSCQYHVSAGTWMTSSLVAVLFPS